MTSSSTIRDTPKISSDCSTINFSDMSNVCFEVRCFPVFLMECTFSEQFFPMNTDASNVEDINILQIIERLSMSCIASFEEWSNFLRNRSFTLFKNDRDFREKFDSVTVSESISSSMTKLVINRSHRSCSQHFTIFPLLRNHLSSMFHSE